MRRWILAALLACACPCVGCGKEQAGSGTKSFVFTSQARTPEGEAIPLVFRPRVGEVHELKLSTSGSMSMDVDGQSHDMPMDMSMTMLYRCEAEHPDGGRTMSMSIGEVGGALVEKAGAQERLRALSEVRSRMRVDRHGAVTGVELEGGDPAVRKQVDRLFNQPGSRPFLVYPAEGVRVGEAIDLTKMFDAAQMQTLMDAPEGAPAPEIRGEAVAVRRLEIAGEDAVEFALNLVLSIRGAMTQDGQTGEVDMSMRLTGTQFTSVATGMPLGALTMTMDLRADIAMDKQKMRMTGNLAIHGAVTKTVAADPAATPPVDEPK